MRLDSTSVNERELLWSVLKIEHVRTIVAEELRDILAGAKRGGLPLGFGENCYYKSKRDLIKSVVYDMLEYVVEDAIDFEYKKFRSQRLKEELSRLSVINKWIRNYLATVLEDQWHEPLRDSVTKVGWSMSIALYVPIMDMVQELYDLLDSLIDKMTDEEVEEYFREVEPSYAL